MYVSTFGYIAVLRKGESDMKLKKIFAACVLCAVLTFSGCSFGSFSVDTLLEAPKLSKEQEGIYDALMKNVGNNIVLKYPRSGSNRSAYMVTNIDDEPTDEAIVFYEFNNNLPGLSNNDTIDSGVRLCVLDKDEKDEWKVVSDIAGAGTDVDRIIVSRLDGSGNISVIVGYSTLSINEKVMEVYNYSQGMLTLAAQDSYSVMETLDIDNDGYNEIITVQSGGDNALATASLLSMSEGQIVKTNIINMSERFQSVASYVKGKLTDYNKALFIDCRYDESRLQTEFLYYKYDSLQNPVAKMGSDLADFTVRPDGYYSTDMDNDGIVEVPTVVPMPGYELAAPEEQMYLTTWNAYRDYYEFYPKYVGYYSISDGYMLDFPEEWQSAVTVKRDAVTGESVFYVFDTSLEESTQEFMRISISSRDDADEYEKRGYKRITSVGQIDYLVRFTGSMEDVDLSKIKSRFYVIS